MRLLIPLLSLFLVPAAYAEVPASPLKAPATVSVLADKPAGKAFRDCAMCPEMLMIAAGSFEMGSTQGESSEQPTHRVSLKAFAIGKTEVTQAQWQALMGNNPSENGGCGDCPVEQVSWDYIQQYLIQLNARTGKQYRLPSEAEWEYACRAGGTHAYCGGNDIGSVAWTDSIGGEKANPVAQKQANGFGLHDMSGNVWEWLEDCWNASYTGAPADGKAWTSGDCGSRVQRGGSWVDAAPDARATSRGKGTSGVRNSVIGFRVASSSGKTN